MKFIGLICFLLLPLVLFKKRKRTMPSNAANARSDYGVTQDGDITLIAEEEKRLDY